jgi:4,5-DOPA dioxygenase extradiol
MTRKEFLLAMAGLPLTATTMKLCELDKVAKNTKATERMPVMFLGHGSPMNAIEENEFVAGFRNAGKNLPKPRAVLCISAHWETRGTFVTAMQNPRTIHDFGGFPKELFDVQYPAPGSPEIAKETQSAITSTQVGLDQQWGLDHGAWSVIKHLFPNADVPVLQMSLDYGKSPQYHYNLAKELAVLRDRGILIIGSGNMVHNLGRVAWDKFNVDNYAFDWNTEASEKMKKWIVEDNHQPLIDYSAQGQAFQLSIPTPDHYLPLLYTLALKDKKDNISLFNDKAVAGALTMTSVKIG